MQKLPIAIASTLIGIVIASIANISGALEKSSFINKSDRPTAFSTFILMADNGENIRAKKSHCIITTQGICLFRQTET